MRSCLKVRCPVGFLFRTGIYDIPDEIIITQEIVNFGINSLFQVFRLFSLRRNIQDNVIKE